jgi:hypothetical protein
MFHYNKCGRDAPETYSRVVIRLLHDGKSHPY